MATILAIHAHPDDLEILASGTLALLAGKGHQLAMITMTLWRLWFGSTHGGGNRGDPLRGGGTFRLTHRRALRVRRLF